MSDDGPGTREVAYRLFAAEFDDASLSYSESDEERAPNYVVTPTGARVNRLFVAGVLTEVERVNDETSRGRVVDPSAAFVTYAGQYQPDEAAFLERAEPPTFVALTGKARTFEPEDSDRVFTSVRPESLNEVDADVRDRWVVSAAEATLDRLAVFERALDSELRGEELRAALESGGAPASLAAGIPKAIDHYDTSAAYVEAIRRLAVDALELIAGEREEVRTPDITPDEGGTASIGTLPETDVRIVADAASTTTGSRNEDTATVDGDGTELADDSAAVSAGDPAGGTDEPTGSDSVGREPTEAESTATGLAESETTGTEVTADDGIDESTDEIGAFDDAANDFDDEVSDFDDEVDGIANEESGGLDDFEDGSLDGSGLDDSGLGDFDDGSDLPDGDDAELDTEEPDAEAPTADADQSSEMYELDDEEREEIESEFGTDFSTGGEVSEPGEADIDVPDPEELSETPEPGDPDPVDGDDDSGRDGDTVDGDATRDSTTADPESTDDDTEADPDDVDLEAAAVETMGALDEGDGADRAAVVEAVVSEHGTSEAAVEDAIQDALMSGKCYEPTEGVLKPI